ncbi:MAG TPA: Na+/H+ antiporter subunit E [Lautropia sp.]|jgi:multicomponent K+:H+ antiporter subunit E|nr:Na+/H+ antiporter subunit E [Lautropia sp.]
MIPTLRRLFPSPYLSAILFLLWLVLNQSMGPGNVLLGALLGIAAPLWTASLRPSRVRLHHLPLAFRLATTVAADVVVSNLQVAKDVWGSGRHGPPSHFIRVPLDMRDAYGLAALAIIASLVPGTVWSEVALDRSALLLHLFRADDDEAYIAYFKQRYERPLMEIFE